MYASICDLLSQISVNVCLQMVIKTLPMHKTTRDLRSRLHAVSAGLSDTEAKAVVQFTDLLEQCLALNPDKRIKPLDALKHSFFASRTSGPGGR